ncbi:MAG: response regulator [Rhodoferax sp.]|uniref:HD domain-containing phosphohydrolase n=1 Tax=Rhodoferax sp. TaxID=50421 RepID=UPI00140125A1|nr:HD domain-containing phosphohydrolase [Rhodoferax sp.]NDP37166.1 response regulator [Rhodoferax sp.]
MTDNSTTAPGARAALLPTILCVDDEPNILSALKRLFRGKGWQVLSAEGGQAALALLETQTVDLVISDMRMPEMDGAQFLARVRVRWPDTVRLLLTGHSDIDAIIEAINRGEIYRYITKPWDDNDIVLIVRQALERQALEHEKKRLEALTTRQNEELKTINASLEAKVEARTTELRVANESLQSANERLKSSFVTSIKVFSTLMEMRGGNLAGHSRRVADLARRMATKLQLDGKLVQDIFVAGLLHEIGKVGFADELLNTPVAMMKPEQLDAYRKHTVQAEQLLLPLTELRAASDIITAQFERFDGTGFPTRLVGPNIPIGTRILSLASDYDNMQIGTLTHSRLKPEEAKILIVRSSGQRYDPEVVSAFLEVLSGVSRQAAGKENFAEMMVKACNLKAGMVLARDLIAPSGLLMLSAEHVFDQRMIGKIITFEKSGGMELTAYIRVDRAS